MTDLVALLQNDYTSMPDDSFRPDDVRIILVGKSGTGKSATGNTILGQKKFNSEVSPEEVTTECSCGFVEEGRRRIYVIDMPGFCGSSTKEDMKTHMELCVELSFPGPHVFLLVINLDARFTAEEVNTVKLIQQNFGKDAVYYTIVLFTREDQLRGQSLQEFVGKSKHLKELIDRCGGRYHAFNNEDMNRTQVTELLKMIDKMITENGGKHYTNEMFQEAQKKIERRERLRKAGNIALGVGSALGTGAAIAGGVVLGVTEIVVLPAVLIGAGTAAGLGMGVKLVVNKFKENRKENN